MCRVPASVLHLSKALSGYVYGSQLFCMMFPLKSRFTSPVPAAACNLQCAFICSSICASSRADIAKFTIWLLDASFPAAASLQARQVLQVYHLGCSYLVSPRGHTVAKDLAALQVTPCPTGPPAYFLHHALLRSAWNDSMAHKEHRALCVSQDGLLQQLCPAGVSCARSTSGSVQGS